MRNGLRQLITRASFALLIVLAMSVPTIVWAQAAEPAKPPVLRRVPPVWIGYLLMAVLLGLVLAVSLLPSKRSHQD